MNKVTKIEDGRWSWINPDTGESGVTMTRKEARERASATEPQTAQNDRPMKLWRLAWLINPRTGRNIVLFHLGADGSIIPRDRKRTGLKFVDEWFEVRAPTLVEARKLVESGKGTRYQKAGEEVHQIK